MNVAHTFSHILQSEIIIASSIIDSILFWLDIQQDIRQANKSPERTFSLQMHTQPTIYAFQTGIFTNNKNFKIKEHSYA